MSSSIIVFVVVITIFVVVAVTAVIVVAVGSRPDLLRGRWHHDIAGNACEKRWSQREEVEEGKEEEEKEIMEGFMGREGGAS